VLIVFYFLLVLPCGACTSGFWYNRNISCRIVVGKKRQVRGLQGAKALVRSGIYILKSEASVCATVRPYFPAPCDKRKHTGRTQQQAASHASTVSVWRHPV